MCSLWQTDTSNSQKKLHPFIVLVQQILPTHTGYGMSIYIQSFEMLQRCQRVESSHPSTLIKHFYGNAYKIKINTQLTHCTIQLINNLRNVSFTTQGHILDKV